MANPLNKALLFFAVCCLAGCASADLPDDFVYETSLRGQQGWYGGKARDSAAARLLSKGAVTSPEPIMETALPLAEINLKEWGVRYFDEDWTRYRVVLLVDVKQGDQKTRCRLSEPESVKDAPLLRELHADDGALIQKSLETLVATCTHAVLNPMSP